MPAMAYLHISAWSEVPAFRPVLCSFSASWSTAMLEGAHTKTCNTAFLVSWRIHQAALRPIVCLTLVLPSEVENNGGTGHGLSSSCAKVGTSLRIDSNGENVNNGVHQNLHQHSLAFLAWRSLNQAQRIRQRLANSIDLAERFVSLKLQLTLALFLLPFAWEWFNCGRLGAVKCLGTLAPQSISADRLASAFGI